MSSESSKFSSASFLRSANGTCEPVRITGFPRFWSHESSTLSMCMQGCRCREERRSHQTGYNCGKWSEQSRSSLCYRWKTNPEALQIRAQRIWNYVRPGASSEPMALLRRVHRISADCVRGPERRIRGAAIWVREARARNSVLEKPSGSSRRKVLMSRKEHT